MIDAQYQAGQNMTVDIRLCGNLTRKEVNEELCRGTLCTLKSLSIPNCSSLGSAPLCNFSAFSKTTLHDSLSCLLLRNKNLNVISSRHTRDVSAKLPVPSHLPLHVVEPPTWAEPAKGEACLEPVCESIGRQATVDLTQRRCFRLGRSPNSDIQLLHATCSRSHAMLFHHANGSCYLVDCNSAHGTFVNGKRIYTPTSTGVVVPVKVRRGAIIRFGGPGAPSFVLKSFSAKLDVSDSTLNFADVGRTLRLNTRLNARGSHSSAESQYITIESGVFRKRSFDSVFPSITILDDETEHIGKRMRCSSPPLSPESPIRLVSPDLFAVQASKPRRVSFSPDPPVEYFPTNEVSTCDNENP